MYTPGGRTGRTPGNVKRIAVAVGIALMGMGGVALAAPKADPGPPEQAQGNGPPPQAHDPAPAPEVKAKTRTPQGTGGPVRVPHDLPPQARGPDNPGSGVGESGQSGASGGAGDHAGPTSGAARGHGRTPSTAGRISGCRAARCRGGASEAGSGGSGGGGGEQSKVTGGRQGTAEGGVLGESEARPDNQAGAAPGERQVGGALESGSALGLDQGGGEESDATRGSFNRALPFTGFELALLAGIGALLGLAGLRLRRSAA